MRDHDYTGRPLVYVAGYYSYNPAHGLANAADAWEMLMDHGVLPVVPHVNLLLDLVHPKEPGFWYGYDLGLLEHCDALFVCDDEASRESAGVQMEIEFADSHGIPIVDRRNFESWVSESIRKPQRDDMGGDREPD